MVALLAFLILFWNIYVLLHYIANSIVYNSYNSKSHPAFKSLLVDIRGACHPDDDCSTELAYNRH